MRYLVALTLVILGTVFGFLGYQTWIAGPPVVLASPAKLAVTVPDGSPLLPGGWTNARTVDLKIGEWAVAGADVEVRPMQVPFSNIATNTVSTAAGKGCAGTSCALLHLKLTDGEYHVQARLHNGQGVSPWLPYRGVIHVDTIAPVVPQTTSSTDPDPKKVYHRGTMTFAWHSSDVGSGIAGYSYRLDKEPMGVPHQELRTASTSVTLKGLDTGQYYFHVASRDVAGNWGGTSTFPVKIDISPPGLAHVRFNLFQFDPQFNPLRISFAVTKAAPQVHVGIYRQSDHYLARLYTLTNLKQGQAASVTWDGKGPLGHYVTSGSYDVYIRATDAYGHSSLSGWRDFVLDYRRIYISLSQQKLYAYDGDRLILTSLVTSGNRELPTPMGTFQIQGKFHPFTFHSPWPKSSPYYYEPALTQYAMLFREGGYFIHDAPWRTAFGPGTNQAAGKPGSNLTGTHGCVNVPPDVAYRLYQWVSPGTVVVVGK